MVVPVSSVTLVLHVGVQLVDEKEAVVAGGRPVAEKLTDTASPSVSVAVTEELRTPPG